MLQGESYVALTGSEIEIADGAYRIAYSVKNGDYVLNGYIYIDYYVVTEQPKLDGEISTESVNIEKK